MNFHVAIEAEQFALIYLGEKLLQRTFVEGGHTLSFLVPIRMVER